MRKYLLWNDLTYCYGSQMRALKGFFQWSFMKKTLWKCGGILDERVLVVTYLMIAIIFGMNCLPGLISSVPRARSVSPA